MIETIKEWMTVREVAEALGISTRTVMRYIKSGTLKGGVLIGNRWRFPPAEVEKLVKEFRTL